MMTRKEIKAANAEKRLERQRQKEAEALAKAQAEQARQEGLALVHGLTQRVPPEYHQWGALRSRVWLMLVAKYRGISPKSRKATVARAAAYLGALPSMELEKVALLERELLGLDNPVEQQEPACIA